MNRMEMPTGWIECSIWDITQPVSKVDPKKNGDRPISYVDISSIDNDRLVISEPKKYRLAEAPSRARQVIETGDVLFSTVRPYLRNIASVPHQLHGQIASTGFSVLRPAPGIDPKFLFYKAISRDFVNALSGAQYGVSYPAVRDDQVRDQRVILPPTAEQRRIVGKIEELFSELDNGVENLRRAQEQLQVYRQALLKQAFEGKLTARWREEHQDALEGPEQLLARINQLHEQTYRQALQDWEARVAEWENQAKPGRKPSKPRKPKGPAPLTEREKSDLPDIPDTWAYGRLGLFIEDIQAGKSFKCDEREPADDEVGVAKVSAVSWGEYDEAESKTCVDPEKVNPALFIRPGDFLFSRANTIDLVGACVIVRATSKQVMLSDKTLRLVFHSGEKEFFLHYLRSHLGRNEIMRRSTGNQESMRNIGQDRIRSIVVPICSLREMAEIMQVIAQKLTLLYALEAAVQEGFVRSRVLRQSILKRALAGELVPQNPSEEPASGLLERIGAERVTASNSKKKRKSGT